MEKKYKIGDKIFNFEIIAVKEIVDIKAVLYEMHHLPTGAKLIYTDTKDNNKHFSVAFKTVPDDDTGVFHILEHSVLGGSKKYPVREPFAELLKSSMSTFLNAMTYPDKTLYPVSSRNEKDFLNLTQVYLDAVFNPAIYYNPNIFYQEGWHYELNERGDSASLNGVVFNEMKGVYSSVDERINSALLKMLFSDTCYQYSSGGMPSVIPTLKYEDFLEKHRKFYCADNAYFYLEGDMEPEKPLALIEKYLKNAPVSNSEIKIAEQKALLADRKTVYYPVSDEDTADKTYITFGKILCDFSDKNKLFAADVLAQYLTSSNEAPLIRSMLSKRLGQDVRFYVNNGIAQSYYVIQVCNTEAEKEEEIISSFKQLVDNIIQDGFDKDELEAIIRRLEFQSHECPKECALAHNDAVLSSYLYGGAPELYLDNTGLFDFLRGQINTDYYENLLNELFDTENLMTVIAKPSLTVAQEETDAENEYVKNIQNSWSDSETEKYIQLNKKLKEWQQTPDTKEQIDTMPTLDLSDVSSLPLKTETKEFEFKGSRLLLHPAPITGISYINLYFPVPAEYENQLEGLSLLANILMNVPTEKYNVFILNQELKRIFGNLRFDYTVISKPNCNDKCEVYFSVSASMLNSNLKAAAEFISEVTQNSDFRSADYIQDVLFQLLDSFRNEIISDGNRIGAIRAAAPFSASGTATECLEGISCYEYLKELCSDFENRIEEFSAFIESAAKKIFTKEKMVIGLTVSNEDFNNFSAEKYEIDSFVSSFPSGGQKETEFKRKLKRESTFISIPSSVSYAVTASNLLELNDKYSGAWQVASKLLSLEYLWNEVRVRSGAYGVRLSSGYSNNLCFSSYRDPSGAKTFDVYAKSGEFLRNYVENNSFERFIISAISDTEPLMSPETAGEIADKEYLSGIDYNVHCRLREEMLNLTPEDLYSKAEILELMQNNAVSCFVSADEDNFISQRKIII